MFMVNQQHLHFKGVAMNKYIISFVLDDNNKMETFTFDSAAERKKFFDSLGKDLPVNDVFPILCLLALNEIANKILNRREK